VPGPGNYKYMSDKPNFKKISFSFGGKFEDPLTRHQNVIFIEFSPLVQVNMRLSKRWIAKANI
jgi:hypothetical protein